MKFTFAITRHFFSAGAVVTGGIAVLASATAAQVNDRQLGEIDFPISCVAAAQEQFDFGPAQLHHMMYAQARPHFRAAEADPGCAMAHWGIAMTSFQPLWRPTSEEGLSRGREAVETARELGAPTEREEGQARCRGGPVGTRRLGST